MISPRFQINQIIREREKKKELLILTFRRCRDFEKGQGHWKWYGAKSDGDKSRLNVREIVRVNVFNEA